MDPENLSADQAQAAWDELAAERTAESSDSPVAAEPADQQPVTEAQGNPAPVANQEPQNAGNPLAGLPPELQAKLAKLDELEAAAVRFAQREREFGAAIGRVAALQREVDAAKKLAPQMSAGPSQAQIAEAAKSPEKWEAMKADFPDLGEAIDERLTQMLSGLQQQQVPQGLSPEQIDEIVNMRVQQERDTMMRTVEELKVDMRHPDWRETANKPEFVAWFQAQDRSIQDLAASVKSADAVRLFDLFAQAQAKPVSAVNKERQSKLAAAATTRPGQTPPPKAEDEMDPVELWNYLAKKRQA